MAGKKEFPISLIVKTVDQATRPLHAITQRLQALTNNQFSKIFSRFGHDLKEFSEAAGFAKLGKGFSGFGGAVRNVGSEVLGLGARLFALAGVASFAFFRIVKGAIDAGDKLAETSQRWGVAVDFAAAFGHAAEKANVPQEAFNASMDTFVKRLGDAKAGGGPLLAFLKKVSPTLADQVKGAKTTEGALSILTDAFTKLKDPAKLAALSSAAFGRGSLQMAQFLKQGGAAIQGQMVEFLRLSGSQEAFAQSAAELDDALKDVEAAFMGLRSAAAGALFPAFKMLAGVVTEFVVKNRDGIKLWAEGAARAIQAWVDGGGFERLIANVRELASDVARLIDWIGGFKNALVTCPGNFGPAEA